MMSLSPSVVCAIMSALLYTAVGMAQPPPRPPQPAPQPPPPPPPPPAPAPQPVATTTNPASPASPRSPSATARPSSSLLVRSSRSGSTAELSSLSNFLKMSSITEALAAATIGTSSVPRTTATTSDTITARIAQSIQITTSLGLAGTSDPTQMPPRPTQLYVDTVSMASPTSSTTAGTIYSAQGPGEAIKSSSLPQIRVAASTPLSASSSYAPPEDGGGVAWILIGSMAGLLAMMVVIATVGIALSLICRRKVKTVSLLKKVVVNNPNYYIPESVPISKETRCDEYESVDELGFTTKAEPSSYPVNDYDSTSPLEHSAKRPEYYEITASRMDTYENGSVFETWKGMPSKECTPDISVVETRRVDPLVVSIVSRDSNEGHFFEESDVYWRPACRFEELYQQLSRMKYREIPTSNIRILAQIGAGEFGMVKRAVWSSPAGPREVAVKMLPPDATEKDQIRFLQEAAVNGQFNFHPNIVHLFGVVTVEKPLMMVLELLESGDLRNYLQTQRTQRAQTSSDEWPYTLLGFCRHVASGMEYLSSKGFVHRDLAARNILVSEERICKIADFGMSRDLDDDTYYISQGGKIPVKWTAPEAIHFKKYSSLSDVWSYGAVLYEIWSFGQKPFEKYTNLEVIKMIDQGFRLGPPPGCPRAMYLLMIQCWHPEKTNRPTFEGIVRTLKTSSSDLLQWSSDDLNVHPLVSTLGADMSVAELLYADLQYMYRN